MFIDTAEAINIRHSSDYLARTQKNLNKLRGEVDGQHQAVSLLEKEAHRLVNDGHYASEDIQVTTESFLIIDKFVFYRKH